MFAACEMRSCVSVSIVDDEILRHDKLLDLTLERTSDLDNGITLDPVNGVVKIIDDDGMYDHAWCTELYTCNRSLQRKNP